MLRRLQLAAVKLCLRHSPIDAVHSMSQLSSSAWPMIGTGAEHWPRATRSAARQSLPIPQSTYRQTKLAAQCNPRNGEGVPKRSSDGAAWQPSYCPSRGCYGVPRKRARECALSSRQKTYSPSRAAAHRCTDGEQHQKETELYRVMENGFIETQSA